VHHPVIIVADAPEALTEFCGISLVERLLRTLQRRMKIWRSAKAHAMVFSPMNADQAIAPMIG